MIDQLSKQEQVKQDRAIASAVRVPIQNVVKAKTQTPWLYEEWAKRAGVRLPPAPRAPLALATSKARPVETAGIRPEWEGDALYDDSELYPLDCSARRKLLDGIRATKPGDGSPISTILAIGLIALGVEGMLHIEGWYRLWAILPIAHGVWIGLGCPMCRRGRG